MYMYLILRKDDDLEVKMNKIRILKELKDKVAIDTLKDALKTEKNNKVKEIIKESLESLIVS